ncbi:phosphotransferase [Arthrobacter zhaoxinii]|uniref:Phosphotransferase n=1 Tax=Arthrobacter zhaoxinii TaxID=2964616 RepID=A0ABY5YPE8_9MICC|nr:phosphotransferase [Arthrobacter zhaoxinii]UWX95968.1 phosphotransferase [Arthrobacter zhaoxinii]
MDDEQILEGGNVSDGVVRVGSTVRKPWTESTPSVFEFMTAVREAGVDVPAVIGEDEQGRQVIEFIPGQLAIEMDPLTHAELHRVGAMVRAIHDASETFRPPEDACWIVAIPSPGDELICHNDLAPWNLIIGDRWAFIDWDAAAPSTRLWDLAYAAQAFTLSNTKQEPKDAAQNLKAFVDGYGADESLRKQLPEAMHQRAAAMYQLLKSSHDSGREPWGSMYVEGHGDHWRAATQYAQRHQDLWSRTLLTSVR